MADTSHLTEKRETRFEDTGGQFGMDVKNKAADLKNKAQQMGGNVAQKAQDAGTFAKEKAGDATSSIGSGMQSLADTIREKAPQEGMIGSASCAVADTLESGGKYLKEEGIGGLVDDLTNVIRRNPIPALLVGFGLGYIIARSMRS
jgi:hypothetical protein